ncbi:hypothetical protein Tco_0195105, partial [Tanacetum coccineum]
THRWQSFVTLVVRRGSLFSVANELDNMRSQHDSSDKYRNGLSSTYVSERSFLCYLNGVKEAYARLNELELGDLEEFHDDIDDLNGPDEKEKVQAISLFKGFGIKVLESQEPMALESGEVQASSFASRIAPELSQYNFTGFSLHETTPKSPMNFFIQTANLAAYETMMYYASVDDNAMAFCFKLFYAVAMPFITKT